MVLGEMGIWSGLYLSTKFCFIQSNGSGGYGDMKWTISVDQILLHSIKWFWGRFPSIFQPIKRRYSYIGYLGLPGSLDIIVEGGNPRIRSTTFRVSPCCSREDQHVKNGQLSRKVQICDKVCRWHTAGRWFSPGILVSYINRPDRHDITETLSKVALNIIKPTKSITALVCPCNFYWR
jgi:hypothetical protein